MHLSTCNYLINNALLNKRMQKDSFNNTGLIGVMHVESRGRVREELRERPEATHN